MSESASTIAMSEYRKGAHSSLSAPLLRLPLLLHVANDDQTTHIFEPVLNAAVEWVWDGV
jgi:hypothetical protein